MFQPRITIARGMTLTAITALNIALVRAFLRGGFTGVVCLFFSLQFGLWRWRGSRGRRRRFWIGFVVSGVAVVVALGSAEFFPAHPLNHMMSSYLYIDDKSHEEYLTIPMFECMLQNPDQFSEIVWFPPHVHRLPPRRFLCRVAHLQRPSPHG